MRTELFITDFEMKQGKRGEFCRFNTSKGWMSCFDCDVFNFLKEKKGQQVEVDIETNGDFTNIIKYWGKGKVKVAETSGFIQPSKPTDSKTTTMYTSYAKDIFIALVNTPTQRDVDATDKLMEASINLVKQAQKAFS